MAGHTLAVFQGKNIRRVWHEGEWWFSIVDVVGALTESADARNYWKVLKHRLNEEGSNETVTKCNQLKNNNLCIQSNTFRLLVNK